MEVSAAKRPCGTWLLITAITSISVAIPTIYFAPTTISEFPYLHSLWALAAFVWFAIALNVVRLPVIKKRLRPALQRYGALAGVGALVLLATLNMQLNDAVSASQRGFNQRSQTINRAVIAYARKTGPIVIRVQRNFETIAYFEALRLALEEARVDFCVYPDSVEPGGVACATKHMQTLKVAIYPSIDVTKPNVLVHAAYMTSREQQQWRSINADVDDWLSGVNRVELTPEALKKLEPFKKRGIAVNGLPVRLPGEKGRPEDVLKEQVEGFVQSWFDDSSHHSQNPFVDSPLSTEELRIWQALIKQNQAVAVTISKSTRR